MKRLMAVLGLLLLLRQRGPSGDVDVHLPDDGHELCHSADADHGHRGREHDLDDAASACRMRATSAVCQRQQLFAAGEIISFKDAQFGGTPFDYAGESRGSFGKSLFGFGDLVAMQWYPATAPSIMTSYPLTYSLLPKGTE